MHIFTDSLKRTVELSVFPPQRIVSLVPSQTELLHDLGLNSEVVGITKFCVHPDVWKKEKTIVGGTKQVHFDKIKALKPDVIIANYEENTKEMVEECSTIAPVYVTNVKTLDDAFDMILNIGNLVGKTISAEELYNRIKHEFDTFKNAYRGSFLYFIWKNPYMVAGQDTFIHAVLSHFGLTNVINDVYSRYPSITEEDIKNLCPEYILLSSEPYPFKEKHVQHFKDVLPNGKIYLVDGEMFSWYGSRMRYTCNYVQRLFANTLKI
jgi:ABC-type Fe3+-hydroxamate transport system substrate-binding protein